MIKALFGWGDRKQGMREIGGIGEILNFPLQCLVQGWKHGEIENYFVWLGRKKKNKKSNSYKFTIMFLLKKARYICIKEINKKSTRNSKKPQIVF